MSRKPKGNYLLTKNLSTLKKLQREYDPYGEDIALGLVAKALNKDTPENSDQYISTDDVRVTVKVTHKLRRVDIESSVIDSEADAKDAADEIINNAREESKEKDEES
ncbi:hypothetical protein [Photobacterium leiognathi]|uniref:hypothetical protein n=1 Tax=Photobacterium leiognathi TaxID=553611 RepID=UPI00298234FA|nr:hypothetical protein [Photobacterium leiognathi]